jgi:RNase adaptor protein for sRNA GlmZ degradation
MSERRSQEATITLMSFGFKYGMPNANYYFDVGFVKNPAREKRWNFFTTPDSEMASYVLKQERAQRFIEMVLPLIIFLADVDQHQIFAFGCNAGRHRSSILIEELSRRLENEGIENNVIHRDLRS